MTLLWFVQGYVRGSSRVRPGGSPRGFAQGIRPGFAEEFAEGSTGVRCLLHRLHLVPGTL